MNNDDKVIRDSDDDDAQTMYHDVVEEFARQLDAVCLATSPMDSWEEADEEDQNRDDDAVLAGYQCLPQDDDDALSETSDDEHEHVEPTLHTQNETTATTPIIPAQPILTMNASDYIDSGRSDLIRSIMTRIEVPPHAVPAWAKTVPESAWMPKLVARQSESTRLSSSTDEDESAVNESNNDQS